MPNIRLLLLDDHTLFRESLSRLLEAEPDFEMVGGCSSVEQAIIVLKSSPVDLVLLDYDLGPQRAPDFLDRARGLGLKPKVLMVTAGISPSESVRILNSGVSGLFLKHSSPALLREAIRKVHAGETWVDQRCLREIVQAAANPGNRRPSRDFTERERSVLRGVFEGLSNKEIGARLEISETSVKAALQQLFHKTGVRTRSQLVRIALEQFAGQWSE
ncbi:MAG TPA: response regulator transcription factor [Bryobacteraceae bacterium]|nr:response regulator transcription factor [Bryobacteraceae bacterium]